MSSYANLVLGPLVIGVVFNTFVYGICVLQFSTYWQFQKKDQPIVKLLVGWTFLLDTFHTCALLYMLWVYVVTEFNNPTFLSTVLWPFSSTPIVTTLTSFPIQIYLAWRILRFSHSTMAFLYLVILSAAQASLGFLCSIKAFSVPEIASYHTLTPFVDAWQVVAVAADGSMTAMLWWYLSKSRTGQRSKWPIPAAQYTQYLDAGTISRKRQRHC